MIKEEYPELNNSESVLRDAENALNPVKEMELKMREGRFKETGYETN